jgi:hypothetical protein
MEKKAGSYYRYRSLSILYFVCFLGLSSCEKYSFKPPEIDPGTQVSYSNDIQPLFDSKCLTCHSSGKNHPYLNAEDSYDELITGAYVDTIVPESSVLYIQMTSNSSHKSMLNDLQDETILLWIQQGAKNN